MKSLICTITLLCLTSVPASARETIVSEQARFTIASVAEELKNPWSVAFLPDGEFLVTERPGQLLRVSTRGHKTAINGVPEVSHHGQGGLLDVVLSPDFLTDNMIYLSYAGGTLLASNTEMARARLNLETNMLEDVTVIFRAEPKLTGSNHYGSRIVFLPDGTLLMTLGERNRRERAQELDHHLGKIVRLNKDGSIPADNPFYNKDNVKPEIYTYGNRNAQGIALQPGTNRIWQHEHGPKGGDEINIIKAGANYGWPEITYGINYTGLKISDKTSAPGMEQPVIYWDPSIAPSGMTFYDGKRFPQWKGDIFVGALAGTHLRRLEVEDDKITGQEVLLDDLQERIRDVRTGPDGYLYILTDSPEGKLLRLSPAP